MIIYSGVVTHPTYKIHSLFLLYVKFCAEFDIQDLAGVNSMFYEYTCMMCINFQRILLERDI